MIIRFTKARHADKKHSLTCTRADGSVTWMAESAYFIQHDLVHYAVEMTLGYQHGFYGLVAKGWDIQDFGQVDLATGQKPEIPLEAGQVEFIVGLLQTEMADGQDYEDFCAVLEAACQNRDVPAPPNISNDGLPEVRFRMAELLSTWITLPPGEAIELEFSLGS
jgi:hypothetical protein